MNPNYMNYFNLSSSTGMSGVSGNSGGGTGLGDFGNQNQAASYLNANMPSSGGSFMDMMNSGPPPMMNTPGQQMARYNHPYNNMYGASGYGTGMENSAMRLQQFANRQMTPRHSFDMAPNQMSQEQINQYYMQMRKIRMMQEMNSQRYNNPNVQQGWPRNMMPNMPPHMPQLSSPQRSPTIIKRSFTLFSSTTTAATVHSTTKSKFQYSV